MIPCKKLDFQAVIKSAASGADLITACKFSFAQSQDEPRPWPTPSVKDQVSWLMQVLEVEPETAWAKNRQGGVATRVCPE